MEQITSRDGTRIGYLRTGSGQPLLLVHGSTASHKRWLKIAPHLESYFTVYNMDRRGRGASGDSLKYDLMREAEDVAALAEAACEQTGAPAAVLGHSFGGLCALEAALLTGQISKLILYEPPVPVGQQMYSSGFPKQMKALLDRGDFEDALELFLREEVKMPEHELAVYRDLPMWQERVKIVPTVLRELVIDRTYRFDAARFARFSVPTLLLLGGDSPPIFRQAIETLEAALPNSRVVVMPGEQHIAIDTNPNLFVKEVLSFLQEHSEGKEAFHVK